jgi:starch synthase
VKETLAVWHVAREYAGVAEAGGVKDVVRGLAEAQARAGAHPTVVLPLYGFLPDAYRGGTCVAAFSFPLPDHDKGNALFDERICVRATTIDGVRLLLVDSPRYAAVRDIYTYTARDEEENHWKKRGTGHWDVHQMNVALQRAALETALALGETPAVFHCHDGHTAFLPAMLRAVPRHAAAFALSAAIVTIHNAGAGYHQEVWSEELAQLLTGLPAAVISAGLLHGSVDPFLASAEYATLTTVSERYAEELLAEHDKEMSGGLGRTLHERGIALEGITNGIDPRPWDPRVKDPAGLPFPFDPLLGDLEGKKKCREELFRHLGKPDQPAGPLYAFVGRLTGQKGVDVLFHALQELLRTETRRSFVILGSGEQEKEAMLGWLASRSTPPGRLVFIPRYDPRLASLIYAASDFFLIPSEYEPCGLTDFIAQIRGSIPVVHHVGGLVKVRDGETGFSYDEQSAAALVAAVERTTRMHAGDQGLLDRIRRQAFAEIYSSHTWDRVYAESYLPLYRAAAPGRGGAWTDR